MMMKQLLLCVICFVAMALCACTSHRVKEPMLDGPTMMRDTSEDLVSADSATVPTAGIVIPELMMPGPLDPIPDALTDEYFVLVMANIGPFASLDQLHASPFYPQLCSLYPELADITDIVDTGKGDLWLLNPWTENTSLSLNEYNIDMFLDNQDPGSGKVYYRTENAKPMLVRMTTDDPGSVLINAVDNEGHQLSWAPASRPADNVLREEQGVANITFNPVDNSVEFGADYEAEANGERIPVRFYADRLLSFGYRMMRYYACHQQDGKIGLLITDGDGQQCYAIIDGYAPDEGFTLTYQQGADLGLGKNGPLHFKRQQ